jgi:hypothetical protein
MGWHNKAMEKMENKGRFPLSHGTTKVVPFQNIGFFRSLCIQYNGGRICGLRQSGIMPSTPEVGRLLFPPLAKVVLQ